MCGRPSPCGPQTSCVPLYGQVATCDPCQSQGGSRPGCRPECLSDFDCRFDQACLGYRCTDPCSGSCGVNAQCVVLQHSPVCFCPAGLTGNPFEHCSAPVAGIINLSILNSFCQLCLNYQCDCALPQSLQCKCHVFMWQSCSSEFK